MLTQPAAAQAEPVPDVSTSTSIATILAPTTYGNPSFFTVTVSLSGPAMLSGEPVVIEAGGVVVGSGTLGYAGNGEFLALVAVVDLAAGDHDLIARFAGKAGDASFPARALPSESAALPVTVAQAPSSTAIASSPAWAGAFAPIDVAAQVTSPTVGLSGRAALLADGVELASAELQPNGAVVFADVAAPAATADLTVAYLGDAAGNFAPSQSAAAPLVVVPHATTTTLTLSPTAAHVGDTVEFAVVVSNVDRSVPADPRGDVELLVDGVVAFTIPAADDLDPETGDGEARFSVDTAQLPFGEHEVSARFVPQTGFLDSRSATVALDVLSRQTRLAVSAELLRATPSRPAVVEVGVEPVMGDPGAQGRQGVLAAPAAPRAQPVTGSLQAFADGAPLGEAVMLDGGRASLTLEGLGVGSHRVELRFTSGVPGVLDSSAVVAVDVSADEAPTGGSSPKPAASLARTGGLDPFLPGAAGLGLLVLGAAALGGASTAGARRARAPR
ncbi:Ig-like domain repeat protein [Leucobacter muris]|uniref:Ig-like domain repeat protein n=1 Tax=Leucobacter muris TaxID=1935379 RepID=A0ABX5QGG3_9MICO|nr:Ig-like domain-containing protein [Leucobacter muris]QAB18093.1 Ig-like domain repeat protein [Leucobacter muris]